MFRFTIRELILLTVIVAMGAAWWVDRRTATKTQDEMRSALQRDRMELHRKDAMLHQVESYLNDYNPQREQLKETLDLLRNAPVTVVE